MARTRQTSAPEVVAAARELKRNPTAAEARLWTALRRKQVEGLVFRRQRPIGPYIVDFYCPMACLVIELDGSVHDDPIQRRRDELRERALRDHGLTVLRFRNGAVEADFDSVVSAIRQAVRTARPVTHEP